MRAKKELFLLVEKTKQLNRVGGAGGAGGCPPYFKAKTNIKRDNIIKQEKEKTKNNQKKQQQNKLIKAINAINKYFSLTLHSFLKLYKLF